MSFQMLGAWLRFSLYAVAMSLLAVPAQAWLFGEDHPTKDDIVQAVQKDLPRYIEVTSLEIGSQETRTGLMEHSESRVKVALTPTTGLYRRFSIEKDGTSLYRLAQEAGKDLEGFLIVRAVASGEGWNIVDIEWDDKKFRRSFGRPDSQLGDTALIIGSPEHAVYAEKKAAELAEIKAVYEAPHKGVLNCKGMVEVDDLRFNLAKRSGSIRYRPIDDTDYTWKDASVEMKPGRQDGEYSFSTPALYGAFRMSLEEGQVAFRNHNCKVISLMPAGEADDLWAEARVSQEQFLANLIPGQIAGKVIEKETSHDIQAEILTVGDRGFALRVVHPIRLNGQILTNGKVATTIMNVRFSDAPIDVSVNSDTKGRGGSPISSLCDIRSIFTPDGSLKLETHSVYGCNETLVLAP